MTAKFRRWMQPFAPLLVALALSWTPVNIHPARAQAPGEPAPAEGQAKGEGRPLDGYLGTAVLMLLALFIVGKSARR
jgi:hypothetical protein